MSIDIAYLTGDGHTSHDASMTINAQSASPPVGIPEWTLGWRMHRALVYLRETTGVTLTAEELGADLGYSRSSVSRWMNDKGPVRTGVLKQWALRCGVDYRWLKSGKTSTPDGGNVMTDCSRLLDLDRYRERHIHAYTSHLALAG